MCASMYCLLKIGALNCPLKEILNFAYLLKMFFFQPNVLQISSLTNNSDDLTFGLFMIDVQFKLQFNCNSMNANKNS